MKKKIFSLILAVMMIFTLVSCDEAAENVTSENVSSVVSSEQSSDVSSDASSDMPSDVPSDVPSDAVEPITLEEMQNMSLSALIGLEDRLTDEAKTAFDIRKRELLEAYLYSLTRSEEDAIGNMDAHFEEQYESIAENEEDLLEAYREHLLKFAPVGKGNQLYLDLKTMPEIEPQMPDILPEYEEGSIQLSDWDKLQYRQAYYCYNYDHKGFIEMALDIVLEDTRGYHLDSYMSPINPETGETLYNEMMTDLCGSPYSKQISQIIEATEPKLLYIIKYFRITREEMEMAIDILYDSMEGGGVYTDYVLSNWSPDHEFREIPNLDIFYTLDTEIIKHYYRRA